MIFILPFCLVPYSVWTGRASVPLILTSNRQMNAYRRYQASLSQDGLLIILPPCCLLLFSSFQCRALILEEESIPTVFKLEHMRNTLTVLLKGSTPVLSCSIRFTTLGGTIDGISDLQSFCKDHLWKETVISQKLSPSLCYKHNLTNESILKISQHAY